MGPSEGTGRKEPRAGRARAVPNACRPVQQDCHLSCRRTHRTPTGEACVSPRGITQPPCHAPGTTAGTAGGRGPPGHVLSLTRQSRVPSPGQNPGRELTGSLSRPNRPVPGSRDGRHQRAGCCPSKRGLMGPRLWAAVGNRGALPGRLWQEVGLA